MRFECVDIVCIHWLEIKTLRWSKEGKKKEGHMSPEVDNHRVRIRLLTTREPWDNEFSCMV